MAEIKDSDIVKYKDKKVQLKKAPAKGENVSVYVRPGDEIDLNLEGLKLEDLQYKLVGGDIVVDIPNQGSFTFVSMALMGYSDTPPAFNLPGGVKLSLDSILTAIEEVNDLPLESVSASLQIKIDQEATKQEEKSTPQPIIIVQEIQELDRESIQEPNENIGQFTQEPIEIPEIEQVDFTSTESSTKAASKTEEAVTEGVKPSLTFTIDIQHIEGSSSEGTVGVLDVLTVQGGGGTSYGNYYPTAKAFAELKKQTDAETINYTDIKSGDFDKTVIHVDNSTFFSEDFTSRAIRLSPSQPEGFALDSITISGLPADVEIVGATNNGGGSFTISKSPDDDLTTGFVLNQITGDIDFVIRYDRDLDTDFEMTISATSSFDLLNVHESRRADFEIPEETTLDYEEDYGVNIKEVDESSPSSYKYEQFAGSELTLGFVLATNLNENIVYTGETDTEVYGSLVSDTINASIGDDTLDGGAGDDTIRAGLGDDTVIGGDGIDTLAFDNFVENPSNPGDGVYVNLELGTATGEGLDTVSEIENLTGSDYKDTLVGDGENNSIFGGAHFDILKGGAGEDTLDGGTGNDTLFGGAGNDTLQGGEGKDTANYSEALNGVTVKLLDPDAAVLGYDYGTGGDVNGGDQGLDRLYSIENVVGSNHDDSFIGSSENNTIDGGLGDDTIDFSYFEDNAVYVDLEAGYATGEGSDKLISVENVIGTNNVGLSDTLIGNDQANYIQGKLGDDFIKGGAGDDTLDGGYGDDTLNGGDGDDEIIGGEGTDTIVYSDATSKVVVNLSDTNAQDTQGAGIDTISQIENLTASNYDDTITGNNQANIIDGLDGSDTVSYAYLGATTDLEVDLNTGVARATATDIDTLYDVENIIGGAGNDTITGDDGVNILDGGSGNDYFIGNKGNDTIIGGANTDTVDYSYSGYNINVTLDNTGNGTAILATETDTLEGIENIKGTNGNDIIISNDTTNIANSFFGGGGNDTLDGGSGNDILDGDSGDDYFYASSGSDTILGGESGETNGDTIDFSNKLSGTTIALTLAEANNPSYVYEDGNGTATDTLYGVENIVGHDASDTLGGNSDNNTIKAGEGADTIYGSLGDDYLDGGDDIDLLDYSNVNSSLTIDLTNTSYQKVFTTSGVDYNNKILNIENIQGTDYADTIVGNGLVNIFYGGSNNDTLDGGANNDTLYGESGADYLIGSAGDDKLYGGDNRDTLKGGTGDDLLDGGDDIDTVDYSDALEDLNIDLSISGAVTISASQGEDTFVSIEGAIGGSGDDIITGTTGTNILVGGFGDDTLLGNGTSADGGVDTLIGGEGSDFISFNFVGANGVSVDLSNTSQQNTGAGNVLLESIENLEGSVGNDILKGNSSNNILIGREGSDSFNGGAGDDTLFGGVVSFNGDGSINTFVDVAVDTADYTGGNSGISVNMNVTGEDDTTLNTGYVSNDGFGYSDTLYGVENIIGTAYNDLIVGDVDDDIANTFFGMDGDDTLSGGAGDDKLDGGDHSVYGDTADYSQRTEAIKADLASNNVIVDSNTNSAFEVGVDETDTLVSIENISGGSGDDSLLGDDNANTLKGDIGADFLSGGKGNDYLDGGDGVDSLSYEYITSLADSVRVDLENQQAYETIGGVTYTDTIKNIEDVIGGVGDDEITGDTKINTLYGKDGDDILDGGGVVGIGTDSLIGGRGNDIFVVSDVGSTVYDGTTDAGATDVDTVDFSKIANSSTDKVDVNLQTGSFTLNGGVIAGTTFIGIEGAIGGAGDDTILGTTTANSLVGGAGDDTLLGNGASSGVDYIDGGETGETNGDFVSFSYTSSNITVDLSDTGVQDSGDGQLIIKNIENLEGGSGHDNLKGNADNNTLRGGLGNDNLFGGDGDDTLDGGGGVDTADYSSNDSAGIKVDLSLAQQVTNDGYNNTDTLLDIEIIKGSDFADTIIGHTSNDTFYGGSGNDILEGKAGVDELYGEDGDDTLRGGIGNDTLDGGANGAYGDTADYSDRTEAIFADLSLVTPTVIVDTVDDASDTDTTHEFNGSDETDTLNDIENIIGGANADTFIGDAGVNTLIGNAGADSFILKDGFTSGDVIDGGSEANSSRGSDTVDYSQSTKKIVVSLNDLGLANVTVDGVAGDHTLKNIENIIGSNQNDTIEGDSANNTLDGDSGEDTISYASSTNASGVIVDLGNSSASGVSEGIDTILHFENILGGSGADTLIGDGGANTITGGSGDDTLIGAGGSDDLIGGSGSDTVSYEDDISLVNVSLRNNQGTDSSGGTDSYDSIENVLGSDHNDTIEGNTANNTLIGGAGVDTLTFENALAGVTVDLSITTAQNTGSDGQDTISGFENLTGSNQGDNLTGDGGVNTLRGLNGDDTLSGGLGADFLYGGAGNDTFKVTLGDGSDTIDGYEDTQTDTNDASNKDTIDYSLITGDYYANVDLSLNSSEITDGTTTDQTDTLANIENVFGSNNDDTITGSSEANILNGSSGDDTFILKDGTTTGDSIIGGTHTIDVSGTQGSTDAYSGKGDTVDYSNITQSINMVLANGAGITNVQVGADVADHTIAGIENIIGSNSADDTITGNSSANTILGLIGNDTIDGGLGDDYLHGGAGVNTLSFESITTNGVSVNLSTNSATGAGADTIINFSNIIGTDLSAQTDYLVGDNSANQIEALAGNDTLEGLGGDDNLLGGAGNDIFILRANDGVDTVDGEAGSGDMVDYSNLTSTQHLNLTLDTSTSRIATITEGADTYTDNIVNIENIKSGAGDDNLTGDAFKNTFWGGAGDDVLDGGYENDTLYGEIGDDNLIGGLGADWLEGGAGDDVLDGEDGNDTLIGGEDDEVNGDTIDYSSKATDLDINLMSTNVQGFAIAYLGTEQDSVKEIENIIGTIDADYIGGDNDSNLLDGRAGDDIIVGAGGADTLYGGNGADIFKAGLDDNGDKVLEDGDDGSDFINGEAGNNTVDYSAFGATHNITLDLSSVANTAGYTAVSTVNVANGSTDYIKNIQNIIGTAGADIISGDGFANSLNGSDGADTLYGAGGADILNGGNDTDRVDYSGAANKIEVDMNNVTQVANDGDGSSDTLISIEEIVGTSYNDTIYGSNAEELFIGGVDADTFMGRGGNDTIYGGLENRTDSASDTVSYAYLTNGTDKVVVDLSSDTGTATVSTGTDTDTLYDIENVIGGAGADTIITRYDEINVIDGADGSDTLDYSSLDTSHSIKVTLADDGATTTVDVSVTTNDDVISNIENITGTNLADSIYGNNLNNTLKGGAGNDTLEGGAGDDYLDGGGDTDTAYYNQATGSVTVNLGIDGSSQAIGGGQGSDTLVSIENVIGSSYDDTFYTNFTKANNFNGGISDDEVNGDTVDYSNLKADVGGANYTGTANADNIFLDLENGTVTVRVDGSSVVDTIVNIENIVATSGDDTLFGDSGNNTLEGALGNDILDGGAGDDYLDGGDGSDTVYYNQATSGVSVNLGIDGTPQAVGGGMGTDTLVSIENVIGSLYADTFIGDYTKANTFNGGMNLTTQIENSSDESDKVDYSILTAATDKIVVDLSNTATPNVAVTYQGVAKPSDTLINIEHVTGTSGDDSFTGNSDSNILIGGAGDDVFYVKEASVGSEQDTIEGGGNTAIGDTVDFSQVSDNTLYVDVDLSSQSLELKNASNTTVRDDIVSGIENVTGTNNDDFIIGDNSDNTLKGAGGADEIYGLNGDDFIDGGTGDDFIKGGSGNDEIDGGADDDTLYGEGGEDEIIGGLGDDTVYGGSENDIIYGDDTARTDATGGADTLYGGDGVDTIYAGYGDDTLSGGANDDTLYGDDGSDTVTYADTSNGVFVNLDTGIATGEGTDELYSIENAIGSVYDDVFVSDFAVSNRFDGNENNETFGDSISYEAITVDVGEEANDKVVVDLSSGADAQGYYDADIYQDGVITNTDKLKNMENITGSAGDDTITGDSDANTLRGLDGDDILSGQGGNDYIHGGDGSDTASYGEKTVAVTVDFKNAVGQTATETDTLVSIENAIGGSAADSFIMNEDQETNTINGGIGGADLNDRISYANYTTNGVDVNLSTTAAQLISVGDTDTILNIEHIIGSSQADTFIGNSEANSIEGGSGNDSFIAGTDTNNDGTMDAWSDDGADYFDGGAGTSDWAIYSVIGDDADGLTKGITVTLDGANEAEVTVRGQAGVDTILNVEHISGTLDDDYIKGDGQNNSLLGNDGDDTLYGEGGIDKLYGGAGDDKLYGGAGDDTLYGGEDNDYLTGGLGSDKIYGEGGIDTVDYNDALENLVIDLDLSLAGGLATDGAIEGKSVGSTGDQGQGIDELYGIENVLGSNYADDEIYGNNNANIITTQNGDDTIEARDGADTVIAGAGADLVIATSASDGADKYDGGAGNSDTLDYSALSENIAVNIGEAATEDFVTGTTDSWLVTITGGDNDIIKGFENIIGGSGDDTIFADSNNNSLYGGEGADTLSGGAGADIINGAGGNDTISYAYLDNTKDLRLDLLNDTSTVIGDSQDDDTIYGIENAIGGAGDDSIQGTTGANILQGGSDGDDTFVGLGGDDTIYGGSYNGVTHTDSGSDTVDYTNQNKITVTLEDDANTVATVTIDSDGDGSFTTGSEEEDSLYGIENLIGSNSAFNGDDTIIGNSASNIIYGQRGADSLNGMAGVDTIYGGDDADTIIGGANGDYLYGDGGNDSFNVGATNIADYSGDVIDGGSEIDTIDYSTIDTSGFLNNQGVEIVLQAGSPANVYVDGDTTVHHTIKNVENVIGTDLKDIITGDNQANTISGMAGDDTLKGNALSDTLYGGAGNDELWGEEGSDLIEGGADNDIIRGGSGFDILKGDAGVDSIYGDADADQIFGGSENDYIEGGADNDTIVGEAGDDTLRGDGGDDIIAGGTVTLVGGVVTASVADGSDTVDYSGALTSMFVDLETDDGGDLASKGIAYSSNLNDQGTDELYDIKNVIGSEEDDILKGNAQNNTLEGRSGDDTLYGEAGEDTLLGGNDNDTLYGGADNDSIDGGSGNDKIYGDAGADTLTGGIGDDIFYATAQNDGADTIDGGTNTSDSDTIDYSALTHANNKIVATLDETVDTDSSVQVYDDSGVLQHTDTIRNIENITGTSGDDTFTGNTSANILIGGAGTDKANYNYVALTAGVTVNLYAGTASDGDTLSSIEYVVGSSYDDSFVTKSGVNNTIEGGTEGDELYGDWIDYSANSSTDLVLDLSTLDGSDFATAQISGNSKQDKLKDIENVIGTSGADTITGTDEVNTIIGNGGADIISTGAEADSVQGGAGDDTIDGGSGADILEGDEGDDTFIGTDFDGDTIDGGTNTSAGDTVDYSQVATHGVTVDLTDTDGDNVTINGITHTISEIENIKGTDQADNITGDDENNILEGNGDDDILIALGGDDTLKGGTGEDILRGGDGDDRLEGGDDDDTLEGGAGDDDLYGGEGSDTADYSNATSTIETDGNFIFIGTERDYRNSIENIIGSNISGSGDIIVDIDLAATSNAFYGLAGDDTITEGAGSDIVEGGAGNDYIYAGTGNDIIDGDDTDGATPNGTSDTLDFTKVLIGDDTGDARVVDAETYNGGDFTGIEIDLSDSNAQRIHAEFGTDTITNIENVIGTGKADYIKGNDASNLIEGRSGNDYLIGLDGADTFKGGDGEDTIDFAVGTGTDDVIVDMTKEQTVGDDSTYRVQNDGYGNKEYIDSIEHIITGSGDDTIYGDSQGNTLITGAGDDTIRGGAGSDYINGGSNTAVGDTIDFSDLSVAVNVNLDTDGNSLNGALGSAISGTNTDTLIDIENVIGTSENDTIYGDTRDNTILSGGGNDYIKGGAGTDYIDGGAGTSDTADFSDGTQEINIDLTQAAASRVTNDGFGNSEYLDGVENIIGTNSADIIIGDSANNKFVGGQSADTLYGNAGDDTLVGGTGADTFRAGAGNDIIYGNEENSSSFDASRDVIDYSDVNVAMDINLESNQASGVGQGVDLLYDIQDVLGSSVGDNITGTTGEVNSLLGQGGDDTFYATLDGDFIFGGSLTAGTHTDSGNDTVDYSAIDATDGRAINVDLSRDDGDDDTNNEAEVQLTTDAGVFDNLEGIENVIGTQNNDIIKGSNIASEVNILDGDKGNDTFYSSNGVDSFIGGEGVDTLDFSTNGGVSVNVDLDQDKTIDDGFGYEDYIANDIEVIIGSTNADIIIGDSGNNTFKGDGGDDTIEGGSGADSIEGGIGDDTLKGGIGDDTLLGGADNDLLYGGEGNDILNGEAGDDTFYFDKGDDVITGGSGADTLTYEEQIITSSGIIVNLEATTGQVDVGTDGIDSLQDHIETIIGTGLADIFNGYTGSDAGDYVDTFKGLAGSDTFSGGKGDDYLDGGEQVDTLIFTNAQNGVNVDLSVVQNLADTNTYAVQDDGFGYQDYVINIENITGTAYGDILGGDANDNSIAGGEGDDTLLLSTGIDTLNGEGGSDWLSLENHEVNIDLLNNTHSYAVNESTTILNIENILDSATSTATRYMWGTHGDNTFIAYDGSDRIYGRDGDDVVDAGAGNDIVYSNERDASNAIGTGIDTLMGGAGTDILEFRNDISGGQSSKVILQTTSFDSNFDLVTNETTLTATHTTINLSGLDSYLGDQTFAQITDGTGNTDYIYLDGSGNTDFEQFNLSSGGDTFVGDNAVNIVNAYEGNDTILGMGGNDIINGHNGNDKIYGGEGNDTIDGGGDQDTILGGLGDDVINGGDGNDIIYDDEGIDTIDGDGGTDTIIFKDGGLGITINLTQTTNNTIDSYGNTQSVREVENVTSTKYVDIITTNNSTNVIKAGDQNDTIFGSIGNDNINGEGGTDLLDYSNLSGGNGVVLQLGDNARIGLDNQTITSIENARGSDYADDITGDSGVNTLWGGLENDIIDGGANDDTLYGEDGDDTLIGGAGADRLEGGANTAYTDGSTHTGDTADYTDIGVKVTINLDNSGNATASISNGNDRLFGIENLTGGAVGDVLSGNDSANTLIGNAGNDTLNGEGGVDYIDGGADADTITGGTGNDTLKGSTGNDVFVASNGDGDDDIDGGDDIDIVDYSSVTGPLNVTLGVNGDATVTIAGTDTLTNIEGFIGTSSNDSLTGNGEDNVFEGRGGNDILTGNGGDDTLLGGDGDDTIFGGEGNDIIDGGNDGANGDWIDYSGSTNAITINLRADADHATGEGIDQITGIEHIDVSNDENGNLVQGDANDNSFIAGIGDDTLSYSGSTTGVTIDFDAGTSSGDGADKFVDFENFIGTNQGDTLINDSVKDDTVFKSFDGGSGVDTADYSVSNQDITVDINGNTQAILTVAGTITDELNNVEIIKTGSGDDIFTLNSIAGLDTLDAGAGSNTLVVNGNFNLSAITLLNFDSLDLDGQTLTMDEDNFSGFTNIYDSQGTGTLRLSGATVNLAAISGVLASTLYALDLNGVTTTINTNNLDDFDTINLNNGTLVAGETIDVSSETFTNTAIFNLNGQSDVVMTALQASKTGVFTDIIGAGNIIAKVEASDTDLSGYTFDESVDTINLSSQNVQLSVTQATNGNYSFTNVGANLTVKLAADQDLSAITFDSNVTHIDLNGHTATLNAEQTTLTILANGGSYEVEDSVTALNTTATVGALDGATAVTVTDTGSVDAGDLNTLDTKTTTTITATSVTTLTGTFVNLQASYDANTAGTITGLGDEAVTITDTQSATNVNGILNKTTGMVTATITSDTASNLNTDLSYATTGTDALSLTTSGTNANATDLNELDGKTSVDVNVTSITDISGTVADIKALYDNSTNFTGLGNENLTITTTGNHNVTDILDFDTTGTLTTSSGNDTFSFDNVAEFNSFIGKFSDIVDSSGTDSISFGSTAVSGDLDFSKLSEFENLNLSSGADDITLSGDEPENIYGLGGDDDFTLDYSNVSSFTTIDGGIGSDEVSLTGTEAVNNMSFNGDDFDNIETLDLSGMNLTGTDDQEVIFTDALLDSWNGSGTNFTLKLLSTDAEHISITAGGTTYDGNDAGDSGNTITETTYNLGNTTLTIDFTDVP